MLSLRAEGTAVEAEWRAPRDDIRVLLDHTGGVDGLLGYVTIEQDGVPCPGVAAPIDRDVAAGIRLRFRCSGAVSAVTVRAPILLDVDPGYQTFLVGSGESGTDRALLTETSPQHTLDLAGGGGQAGVETPISAPLALTAGVEQHLVRRLSGPLDAWVLAGLLGLALAVGAGHALAPGHGKSIAAAYLVGERGRPHDAALLGVAVAGMHTASVLGLGIITWATTRTVAGDGAQRWLAVLAGVAVTVVGASMVARQVRARRAGLHGHHHHAHGEVGAHTHAVPDLSLRGLLAIGAVGGLLPSPSALVAFLAAIAAGRLLLGLAVVTAFSVGLAVTVTASGLLVLWGRDEVGRRIGEGRFARIRTVLPAGGAAAVVLGGLLLTGRAVMAL